MREKKRFWIPLMLMFPVIMVIASIPVQAHPIPSPVTIYAKMPAGGFIPGAAIGGFVMVEVWIDSPADAGIVATGITLAWDPAVLELGYTYWSPFPPPGFWVTLDQEEGTFFIGQGFTTTFLDGTVNQAAGTVTLTSIAISAWQGLDHGEGANGTGLVVTYWFTSKLQTAYSLLNVTAEFGTHDGALIPDVVIDGHYNKPPNGIGLDAISASNVNLSDPIGSHWHEEWPDYCQNWTLTSWTDNGDGKLSGSDQIDMTNDETLDVVWYHVEWVNPDFDPETDQDDGLPDMMATEKPEVPEFPLGVGLMMILAPLIPIVYLWRTRKRW